MTTVAVLERLVPEGVRVRQVAGGFILSDGQWTTSLAVDDLPASDDGALGARVEKAVLTLRSARHGEDVSPYAERDAV